MDLKNSSYILEKAEKVRLAHRYKYIEHFYLIERFASDLGLVWEFRDLHYYIYTKENITEDLVQELHDYNLNPLTYGRISLYNKVYYIYIDFIHFVTVYIIQGNFFDLTLYTQQIELKDFQTPFDGIIYKPQKFNRHPILKYLKGRDDYCILYANDYTIDITVTDVYNYIEDLKELFDIKIIYQGTFQFDDLVKKITLKKDGKTLCNIFNWAEFLEVPVRRGGKYLFASNKVKAYYRIININILENIGVTPNLQEKKVSTNDFDFIIGKNDKMYKKKMYYKGPLITATTISFT